MTRLARLLALAALLLALGAAAQPQIHGAEGDARATPIRRGSPAEGGPSRSDRSPVAGSKPAVESLSAPPVFDPTRDSTGSLSLRLLDDAPAGAYTITLLSDEPAGAEVTAWPASPVPPGDCPDCPTCPPPRPCPAPDCRPEVILSLPGDDPPVGVRGDQGLYRGCYVPWQLLADLEEPATLLHCRVAPGTVVGRSMAVETRPPTKAERMQAALATVCDEGEVPWAGSLIGPADDSHVVARCVAGGGR